MNYKCPCCGHYTLEEEPGNTFDICPVCFWEDDLTQLNDLTNSSGANPVSLEQARRNYLEFGACEPNMLPYVRKPYLNELKEDIKLTK